MFSDKQTGQNTGGGAPQIIMQFNTKVESNTIVEAEDGSWHVAPDHLTAVRSDTSLLLI